MGNLDLRLTLDHEYVLFRSMCMYVHHPKILGLQVSRLINMKLGPLFLMFWGVNYPEHAEEVSSCIGDGVRDLDFVHVWNPEMTTFNSNLRHSKTH